jgi:rhodanese-related sulfurtransferase
MATGYKAMLDAARAEIDNLAADQACLMQGDEDIVFVDLRDIRELGREGKIPGAFHAPRGMLEFWIDPSRPYHKDIFASDKHLIFYCASGWRSALAAKTAQDMGVKHVSHIDGGFTAWKEAGGAVEIREKA